MKPYADGPGWTLFQGDSLKVLGALSDSCVDAMVTDPPAGISFMSKAWDQDKGGRDRWVQVMAAIFRECLRVMKPGAHGLVWALPRTSHWTATALEDAGFEVRDVVTHLFGTGFPKSLNVGKALDKAVGAQQYAQEIRAHLRHWRDARGFTNDGLNEALGMATNGGGRTVAWMSESTNYPEIPSKDQWGRLREVLKWPVCPLDELYILVKDGAARPTVREWKQTRGGSSWGDTGTSSMFLAGEKTVRETAPATDAAKQWEGFGTALKPASEHWILVRKPLGGTVAANVLEHGTGVLNIDGCRVEHKTVAGGSLAQNTHLRERGVKRGSETDPTSFSVGHAGEEVKVHTSGRWPANLVLSHSPDCGEECAPGCPVAEMDRQSAAGGMHSAGASRKGKREAGKTGMFGLDGDGHRFGDSGGASRFFYVAKPSKRERSAGLSEGEQNKHPTVKSIELMRRLCRLIVPPGGLVLDPFCGSGSTGVAALREGLQFAGIEREEEYLGYARQRIENEEGKV